MVKVIILEHGELARYAFGAKDFQDALFKVREFLKIHNCPVLDMAWTATETRCVSQHK